MFCALDDFFFSSVVFYYFFKGVEGQNKLLLVFCFYVELTIYFFSFFEFSHVWFCGFHVFADVFFPSFFHHHLHGVVKEAPGREGAVRCGATGSTCSVPSAFISRLLLSCTR